MIRFSTFKRSSLHLTALFALCCLPALGQVKKPEPAPVKVPFSNSLQAVVVTTDDWTATSGTAQLFERRNVNADWRSVGKGFPVVLGRNGLAWESGLAGRSAAEPIKREGDGKAPAGMFPLTTAFGSGEKPEQLAFPYTKLVSSTECVDDVKSSFYNKLVDRYKVGNFDWTSSEKMLAVGPEYELGVFVAHNTYPITSGMGSCIFLHIWKDSKTPTSGCTAMARTDLERILGWIDGSKNPYLVQLTSDSYSENRKAWKLPKLK